MNDPLSVEQRLHDFLLFSMSALPIVLSITLSFQENNYIALGRDSDVQDMEYYHVTDFEMDFSLPWGFA